MREILFRGKRTDNGEWETGSLVVIRGGCSDEQIYIADKMTGYKTPVHKETIGQYTGLTDKNGTKIFEGDIVTGYFNYEKIIGYIFYGGNAQFFIQRDGILGIGLDNADCWLEVVGNIYDNPELLGEPMKPASKNVAQSGLAPATENFELLEG